MFWKSHGNLSGKLAEGKRKVSGNFAESWRKITVELSDQVFWLQSNSFCNTVEYVPSDFSGLAETSYRPVSRTCLICEFGEPHAFASNEGL